MTTLRSLALVVAAAGMAAAGVAHAAELQVPGTHKTIQSAIDAARTGDVVLVAPGRYRERLRMKPGVAVRSAGDDARGKLGLKRAEATTIDGAFKNAAGPGVAMAEGSTLDGFTVTGVGRYDDEKWKKHHATRGEEQKHEHIGEPGTAGISVIGVTCIVRNNIVHHVGYTGIAIMGARGKRTSPLISHNVCFRNMGGGIGSMKKSTAVIEHNVCFQNFYAGIGHDDASPTVTHNICYENVRAGIGISEHSKAIVRHNRCYKNRRAGIGIRSGEETTPIVEHNECYENDMAGIGARHDAAPLIRHNRCYKNAMAGIGCRTGARPVIEHNECFENKMAGIGCRSKAAPVIRFNRCHDNVKAGIGSQSGAQPVIVGNKCYDNTMAGIGTETKAVAVIRDNQCYRNRMAGIGARTGARPIIEGNHCYENRLAGIGAEDKSAPVIRNNRSEKNGEAGIGTRKGARSVIIENECRGNTRAGIGVREKGTAIILGNKCIENKLVAIGVRNGSRVYIARNELQRTGGMPPMIAIRENSSAIVTENRIRGGGVAGVMVQGKAFVSGNRFEGNGPRPGGPPNFAAWVHGGSSVIFTDNRIDRWRHALYASEAQAVHALDNVTSGFLRTSIVVQKSKTPTHVFGNIAISRKPSDQPVSVSGSRGVVAANERRPQQNGKPAAPSP